MSNVENASSTLIFAGSPAAGAGTLWARPAPTQQDLTLRPGDKITRSPAPGSPHRVQFGGPADVTGFSMVRNVLKDINPPLTGNSQDVATAKAGQTITATVKDDAHTQGVSEFNFTCGFPPHTPQMITVPFKIAPPSSGAQPRHIQIVTNPPMKWILKTDHGDTLLGGH